jgi:hypothetical protein
MAVPILLAAGLLGGLGPGPLSRGEARNDDGAVRIESIVPEPERTSADPEGLTYDFALAGPATIRFQHEFVRSGLVHGAVRAEGSPSLRFTQFVFP